ncbi:MAG: hypothetical protein Q8S00_21715 [Deltaproteobacteria bacterium]|nr:hypothetical protein [Deltaproteobacteria bacterium]
MPLRTFFPLFALVVFFGSPGRAEEFNIYFKASPRLELLYPYSDPATLTLLITGADGRPVTQGSLAIRLDAPKPGPLFSTDFPFVEGSRLLEMTLPLRQGKAEWKYLFPIRGEYLLAVDFVAPDGRKAARTFNFKIRESKQKWFFLGLFSLALFVVGMVAGRIFTPPGLNGVKGIAGCLLLALGGLLSVMENAAGQATRQGEQFGWLEVDPATVGKPTSVRWRLGGDEQTEKSMALLALTIAHPEKDKIVFALERLPVAGEFAMKFQFTDGAEYRVAAIAHVAGRPTLRTERNISVIAAEPPVRAMIPAVSFFVAIIVLGLAVGRWSKLRATKTWNNRKERIERKKNPL